MTDIVITPPPATTCLPPATSSTPPAVVSGTSATLHWPAAAGAAGYKVRYHITGSSSWLTTSAVTNSVIVTGLAPWAAYEFQVQTVCGSSTSAYSVSSLFSTGGTTALSALPSLQPALVVTPNPTEGSCRVRYSLAAAVGVSLEIYDMMGKTVTCLAANEQQSSGEHSYRVQVPNPGIYLVKLATDDGRVALARLTKL